MHPKREPVTTVDEYINLFPAPVQAILTDLRQAIKGYAPEAEEVISYSIPAYKYHGMLIFFSAYTHHISISFPPHNIMEAFQNELTPYKTSKSTIQFPLDKPLPLDLIKRMVEYKIKENLDIEAEKHSAHS